MRWVRIHSLKIERLLLLIARKIIIIIKRIIIMIAVVVKLHKRKEHTHLWKTILSDNENINILSHLFNYQLFLYCYDSFTLLFYMPGRLLIVFSLWWGYFWFIDIELIIFGDSIQWKLEFIDLGEFWAVYIGIVSFLLISVLSLLLVAVTGLFIYLEHGLFMSNV